MNCELSSFDITAANPPANNYSTLLFGIQKNCGDIGPVVISVDNAGVINGFLPGCPVGLGCAFSDRIPQSVNIVAGSTYPVLVWIYPFLGGSSGNYNVTIFRAVYNVTAN